MQRPDSIQGPIVRPTPRAGEPRPGASAPVMEVFASVQGEGWYVGEPQVFLRLRGCPLRCQWCDTPGSWVLSGGASGIATAFQAACRIAEAERGGVQRTVSVTGGEPLAWPEFVRALKTFVRPRRVHLETAGAHPRALRRVLASVDHVSLDLKLPADLDPPVELAFPLEAGDSRPAREPSPRTDEEWRAARRACLALVRGRDACAKLVVAGGRQAADFAALIADQAELAPDVPLVIQPVTPMRGVAAPARGLLEEVAERALERGLAVRVLPQVHRALGLP